MLLFLDRINQFTAEYHNSYSLNDSNKRHKATYTNMSHNSSRFVTSNNTRTRSACNSNFGPFCGLNKIVIIIIFLIHSFLVSPLSICDEGWCLNTFWLYYWYIMTLIEIFRLFTKEFLCYRIIFIDANVFCRLRIDFNIEDVIVLENVLHRKQKYTHHPIILNNIFCHLPHYTYSHLYS